MREGRVEFRVSKQTGRKWLARYAAEGGEVGAQGPPSAIWRAVGNWDRRKQWPLRARSGNQAEV